MAHMKITEDQARRLLDARTSSARKGIKRQVFAEIHRQHPSLGHRKITIFIENPSNPLYCVIRDKYTKLPIDDGKPAPVAAPAPAAVATPAPVAAPAVDTAKPATKAVAKPAAKPATKAVAKPAAKPATKAVAKPAAKPATKAVAKPAAKPAIKAVAKPATKPATKAVAKPVSTKDMIDVRITVNGQRIRLGYAADEAAKAKMIAKYKKANGIK